LINKNCKNEKGMITNVSYERFHIGMSHYACPRMVAPFGSAVIETLIRN